MSFDQDTKTLVQVIQDLSAAKSLSDITVMVRKAARKIAQADGVTFVLKDQDMCSYVDEEAIAPLWKGQKFPLNACVSGWAMIHKEAVIIEDIYKDTRVPIDAYRPTFVKSMAMTPIRQENPIGAIGTYWKDQHRPTSEQMELLQALANSASIAIENVGLYNSLSDGITQLKKANQAKDEFLMNLSHELRTPLNAIIGWSEILTEDNSDKNQLSEGLQIILKNSNHQLHIVEDLMDSSRILVGRIHLKPVMVDLHQIVRQSIAGQQTIIMKKNILVDMKTELNSATIKADPVRLRQIVDNIIVNALKFSFKNGKIDVRLKKSGPNVELIVQDQGEGIDESLLPHVFERLKQGDESTTRKHGGLGLGLSIAKHLTEASDGQIKAESAGMGQGATFTVSFPLQEFELKPNLGIPLANTSSRALENIRVLVVDDDDDARQVAALALRNQGARVSMAGSVYDALHVDSPDHYEVIVCDLSMPEEDGFSFVKKIRQGQTPFQNHIPVLALTAFADQGTKEKALHDGFDLFLEKPFKASYLVSSVAGAI
jgi:two-component system CheB/CheR fusion protein